jgi:hypothetical protein
MQNLYLDRQIDFELSDSDDNVPKEPVGDDTDGGGGSSAEHIAPNPMAPMWWSKPILQLLLGLKGNVPHVPSNACNPNLQLIR